MCFQVLQHTGSRVGLQRLFIKVHQKHPFYEHLHPAGRLLRILEEVKPRNPPIEVGLTLQPWLGRQWGTTPERFAVRSAKEIVDLVPIAGTSISLLPNQ